MCIRDSSHTIVREADLRSVFIHQTTGDAHDARVPPFKAMEQGIVHQAVSYTHLRAHETVLDLVCRLLLEKKKKK